MTTGRSLRGISAALLLFGLGCGRGPGPAASAEDAKPAEEILILGRVIAANATKLRAPPNEFRVGGWGGGGGPVKFTELKADGAKVKKGDVVARFHFNWDQALRHFQERLREEQAAFEKSAVYYEQEMRELKAREKRIRIAAQLAEIDTKKKRAISKNRMKFYEGTHTLRRFEETALAKRIAALEKTIRSETHYYRKRVDAAQARVDQFHRIKEGFSMLAPHDGVVRHGFHPWKRRKVRKGDNIRGGMEAVSIAKDDSLMVKLFVPERKLKLFKKGGEVVVRDPANNNKRHSVTITEIGDFPQEIGFLIEDGSVPQAREKAFVVKAAFKDVPAKLSVGGEIKGELP